MGIILDYHFIKLRDNKKLLYFVAALETFRFKDEDDYEDKI